MQFPERGLKKKKIQEDPRPFFTKSTTLNAIVKSDLVIYGSVTIRFVFLHVIIAYGAVYSQRSLQDTVSSLVRINVAACVLFVKDVNMIHII